MTLACIMAAVALVVLVVGLGEYGLWSEAELAVLDRTRAALGEPLSDLLRHPFLPDALRTWSYDIFGGDLGLRLPGAVASVVLVALATGIARSRGASPLHSALAGAFVLSFPGVLAGARTVLGNPIAEATAVVGILLGIIAAKEGGRGVGLRVVAALGCAVALAASTLSTGLLLGAALPLCVIALADDIDRRAQMVAWAVAGLAFGMTVYLAWGQGDGFIPLLGAAKDVDLLENPERRSFTASLEDLGYFVFPFGAALVVGATDRRGRWPALWLVLGLALVSAWGQVYGPIALPLAVPAGLLCANAVGRCFSRDASIEGRRMGFAVVLLGIAVFAKDAQWSPSTVASPLFDFASEGRYPDADTHASELLHRAGRLGMFMFALAFALSPASRGQTWSGHWSFVAAAKAKLPPIPAALRRWVPAVVVLAMLLAQTLAYGHGLVSRNAAQLSAKGPFLRHARWVQRGLVPEGLAIHRIRDPGLDVYGPARATIKFLNSRNDLQSWLSRDSPQVAVIRASEFPSLYQRHRHDDLPLHVLDWRHHELKLIANFVPDGIEVMDPLEDVVSSEPIELEHETYVKWESYVELVAWQIDGPVRRGGTATLHLLFRPLRHMPAGTQLSARLQMGKLSRIGGLRQELTGGAYPPNYWREGDYIHHQMELEVPTVEVLRGEHKLIVGLSRTEKRNFEISLPEKKEGGAHGVTIRDKKHEFAEIGLVEVR